MFLKSLTIRGFKSFADRTRLDFEPGITVVVGPNGSGKSNIVDALAWVLGTASAKTLRGGQMADVIFAGSPGRPAHGRATVEITIDNSSGALPIEFSEVTIGRGMFATGEGTYAINDVDCRLLDVQELLSDTGLGREAHTIVGQGQIDAVLNARPEERRAFIEEAAGILKHRKRKERALRKLASVDAHVERLGDVLRELRRQLRPLERQAEAARKHTELSDALREVRRTRALRAYKVLVDRWEADEALLAASALRLARAADAVDQRRAEEARIEEQLRSLAPDVRRAAEVHFSLSNLVERYRGLGDRIAERRAGLVDAVEEPVAGRDPEQLRDEAAALRGEVEETVRRHEDALAALREREDARRRAEQARRAHEQAAAAEARRRAEARERLIRWEGEVGALRSALARAAAEEGRLGSQAQAQDDRAEQLRSDIASVQGDIQRLDSAAPPLAAHVEAAEALATRRQAAAVEAARAERDLERRRASLEARADALFAASQEAGEGTVALARAAEEGAVDGVLGRLADLLVVADAAGAAVAAALGPLGDALVVEGRAAAERAIGFVRDTGSGRVLLLVSDLAEAPGVPEGLEELGAEALGASLDGPPSVVAAVRRALGETYLVDDLAAAAFLAGRRPECTFVSRAGEVCGPRGFAGGAPAQHSAVASRAAAEAAAAAAERVAAELLVAHRRVADADRGLEAARHELDAASAALQESDGLITGAAERLGRLRKELVRCDTEREATATQQAALATEMRALEERLAALEARGPEPHVPDPRFPDEASGDLEAERLDDALRDAREAEVRARLEASAREQEGRELERRVAALLAEADEVERQLAEREQRRRARVAAIARCDELDAVAGAALARTEASLQAAAAARDAAEESRGEQQRRLGAVRAAFAELVTELESLRDDRHREELARAELEHELADARTRLVGLEVDPGESLAHADPAIFEGGEEREAALQDEEDKLGRKVGLLGAVNPLAVQEHQELSARHDFLVAQLDDLRASKRDLLEVLGAVDERIREVFAEAFADVAAQFEVIFPRLFPGGSGKLVLTEPDDLLTSGVEVEARPPGKRVKRLSLLSGGERSLTALAVLFAIFTARPSPFYVLDEVEAALDDTNLQRFLDVLKGFRGSSQMIVVTHQRRTMEVADTLYGISMRADGVSRVVSERLHEVAPA